MKIDDNLSAFLADIHVSGKVEGQPTYQNPLFTRAVDRILTLSPRPRRAVIFGDVALWTGRSADYEASMPDIQRLRDAGIDVHLTVGNHDRREQFFRFHPRQAEITPVPGRAVSVIDLGHADLVLLDTLDERPGPEGTSNEVGADFDKAQADWLVGAAASAKRPFFIGSHHAPFHEPKFTIGGKPLFQALGDNPLLAGFVYGHDHSWSVTWRGVSWASPRILKCVCLPSTGWWGTIGFALMKTYPSRAKLSLELDDFFYPSPPKEGAARPPEWDTVVRETAGAACAFPFGRTGTRAPSRPQGPRRRGVG